MNIKKPLQAPFVLHGYPHLPDYLPGAFLNGGRATQPRDSCAAPRPCGRTDTHDTSSRKDDWKKYYSSEIRNEFHSLRHATVVKRQ